MLNCGKAYYRSLDKDMYWCSVTFPTRGQIVTFLYRAMSKV